MAVKISGIKPTVTCPATLFLPDDNGAYHQHKYDVIFKRLSTQQRDELHQRYTAGASGAPGEEAGARLTNAQLLDEIVEGWSGMLDENGAPVPYSHAERRATDALYPGLEQSMAVAWYDTFFAHQREAARKNSEAQSGTTSAATAPAAT